MPYKITVAINTTKLQDIDLLQRAALFLRKEILNVKPCKLGDNITAEN